MDEYMIQPRGVCSRAMRVEVDEKGIIRNLQVIGGCNGNLQGISALVEGMEARGAIRRLKGIDCCGRGTSCPDQFAKGLEQALDAAGK